MTKAQEAWEKRTGLDTGRVLKHLTDGFRRRFGLPTSENCITHPQWDAWILGYMSGFTFCESAWKRSVKAETCAKCHYHFQEFDPCEDCVCNPAYENHFTPLVYPGTPGKETDHD